MSSNLTRCIFLLKNGKYQCLEVCCPESIFVPISLFTMVYIPHTLMSVQSTIKIEKSSDGLTCPGHVLTHNKVLIFARTPVNIKVSMSSAPKLALVPASRYKSGI